MSASRDPLDVIIAGGGVAGLEAILALRALAGDRVRMTLVTDVSQTLEHAVFVGGSLGRSVGRTVQVSTFAHDHGVDVHFDRLLGIHPERHLATLASGRELPYGALVVATGARFGAAMHGATPFRGPRDAEAIRAVVAALRDGTMTSVALALTDDATLPLPLYELALMMGAELRAAGTTGARITLVTPEPEPLALFGPAATEAVTRLMAADGVAVRSGGAPRSVADGLLVVDGAEPLAVDGVIATTGYHARVPLGVPRTASGFVPVDAHGRVPGVPDVYAAGDVTNGPLKQGGLGAQQADAAAQAIAARAGAISDPAPLRPVLRGMLLTGGRPLYLRAELSRRPDGTLAVRRSEASTRPLWSPPTKVAAPYLSPYVIAAGAEDGAMLVDRPADAEHDLQVWQAA